MTLRSNQSTQSRRQFLNTSVRAGAVVMAAPLLNLSALAQDAPKKLGFALLGLGSLSTNQIAPALQKTKLCRLVGIVTGTPAKEKIWAAKYDLAQKNIYNYENFDKIIDNPDIDVVYVVTPNARHAEFVARAARAGKHVLCEKPMEVSVKKCEEMIAACKKAKCHLAIGYRCQFTPYHLEMRRLAQDKVFGDLKLIEASFGFRIGDPNQSRLKHALAGGGAQMEVGVYAL